MSDSHLEADYEDRWVDPMDFMDNVHDMDIYDDEEEDGDGDDD